MKLLSRVATLLRLDEGNGLGVLAAAREVVLVDLASCFGFAPVVVEVEVVVDSYPRPYLLEIPVGPPSLVNSDNRRIFEDSDDDLLVVVSLLSFCSPQLRRGGRAN